MSNSNSFQTGQHVRWNWGSGTYLIKQDDGDEVLKLGSELQAENS